MKIRYVFCGPLRFFVKSKHQVKSSEYWEQRYKKGGDSGAGSLGKLAQYKADFLNDFCAERNVNSVVELGCGDGNQLSLSNYNKYVGFDISETAIAMCYERFRDRPTMNFLHYSGQLNHDEILKYHSDLGLSLDVIYHLIEDEVYHIYLDQLFGIADKYVIIYSDNNDKYPELRKVAPHVKRRRFTDFIEANIHEWRLSARIDNPYPYDSRRPDGTSFSDFFIYEKREKS